MDQRKSLSRGDYILLVLFLAIVIASIIPVLTNIAFIEMVPEHMALFLIILVSISTMMAGIIFTNFFHIPGKDIAGGDKCIMGNCSFVIHFQAFF